MTRQMHYDTSDAEKKAGKLHVYARMYACMYACVYMCACNCNSQHITATYHAKVIIGHSSRVVSAFVLEASHTRGAVPGIASRVTCHVSCVACDVLRVACRMSRVTCYTSHVTTRHAAAAGLQPDVLADAAAARVSARRRQ
jgi:hypothetical protein